MTPHYVIHHRQTRVFHLYLHSHTLQSNPEGETIVNLHTDLLLMESLLMEKKLKYIAILLTIMISFQNIDRKSIGIKEISQIGTIGNPGWGMGNARRSHHPCLRTIRSADRRSVPHFKLITPHSTTHS
jgi:hypothetical protein